MAYSMKILKYLQEIDSRFLSENSLNKTYHDELFAGTYRKYDFKFVREDGKCRVSMVFWDSNENTHYRLSMDKLEFILLYRQLMQFIPEAIKTLEDIKKR